LKLEPVSKIKLLNRPLFVKRAVIKTKIMDFLNDDKTPNQFLMVSKEDLKMALLKMVEEMVQKPAPKIWIHSVEAMNLLGIKSKTTLQSLRDSGEIEFSQPMKKVILYKYESILAYLEKHAQKIF
jgi:hypothetical protein